MRLKCEWRDLGCFDVLEFSLTHAKVSINLLFLSLSPSLPYHPSTAAAGVERSDGKESFSSISFLSCLLMFWGTCTRDWKGAHQPGWPIWWMGIWLTGEGKAAMDRGWAGDRLCFHVKVSPGGSVVFKLESTLESNMLSLKKPDRFETTFTFCFNLLTSPWFGMVIDSVDKIGHDYRKMYAKSFQKY